MPSNSSYDDGYGGLPLDGDYPDKMNPDGSGGVMGLPPGFGITDPKTKAADPTPAWLTPWAPGASQPNGAPPGQHWDPNTASFVADQAATTNARPTGGNLTDPNYAAQYVAWAGTQPGVNPSVKNDPGYWTGRFTSGAFGNDQEYALQRMMQAEGPPEGAQVGTNNNGMLTGSADTGQYQQLHDVMSQQLAMQQQQMQQQQAMRDQFRQAILGQLGTLQNDTTSTDPNGPQLHPIISAYHVQSQRGLDRTRNALAEAAYANGGGANYGGLQTQEQGALENAGAAEANFTGQQVSQAVTARQQQLQHLLDVGAGFLSQGDQQAIQTELAQLQAQLANNQLGYQYSALGQQNDQFGRSLAQNNEQFGNNLGYNYTALQAQMNQQALLQALGY